MARSTWQPRRVVEIGLAAVALAGLVACSAAQAPSEGADRAPASAQARALVNPREGLYADASQFGNLVWTAGHLPEGIAVAAPIEDQVDQALDNLEATLEAAGAGFDTVLKANVYLTDFDEWDAFNEAFRARMEPHGLPPRTTVEVGELGGGYRVEIEMVAHLRGADAP
jgi:2-iminobutanoate/2-iminopropanoate deaminase